MVYGHHNLWWWAMKPKYLKVVWFSHSTTLKWGGTMYLWRQNDMNRGSEQQLRLLGCWVVGIDNVGGECGKLMCWVLMVFLVHCDAVGSHASPDVGNLYAHLVCWSWPDGWECQSLSLASLKHSRLLNAMERHWIAARWCGRTWPLLC